MKLVLSVFKGAREERLSTIASWIKSRVNQNNISYNSYNNAIGNIILCVIRLRKWRRKRMKRKNWKSTVLRTSLGICINSIRCTSIKCIVISILSIYFHDLYLLYDPNFTYSYVFAFFASWFGKDPKILDQSFHVVTPVRKSLLVRYMYKLCEVSLVNKKRVRNLIVLDMLEFNVALGMDWFATYHATFDCHLKMVKFNILSKPSFLMEGDWSSTPYNLIFVLGARKLLIKGC